MFEKLPFLRKLYIKFLIWDIETEFPIDSVPFKSSEFLEALGKLFQVIKKEDFDEDLCVETTVNLSCSWVELLENLACASKAAAGESIKSLPHGGVPKEYSAYELLHREDDRLETLKIYVTSLGNAVKNNKMKRSSERALKPLCEDLYRLLGLLTGK